jgi:hypothetical protein
MPVALLGRLVAYAEAGGQLAQQQPGGLAGFLPWLAASEEQVLDLPTGNFTHFDNVVAVQQDEVRLLRRPEELVFVSAKTASPPSRRGCACDRLNSRPGEPRRGPTRPSAAAGRSPTRQPRPQDPRWELSTDRQRGLGGGTHGPHPGVACGPRDGLIHQPQRR